MILDPVPFEDKWGVPWFSIDSRGRVYDREVYIDEEGTWHEGGLLSVLGGPRSQEELALPGEPHHDFLPIEIQPDKQDIYSSSARRIDEVDIMKTYDYDVLEDNVCKEAYLSIREEMSWGEVLPVYTAMTVGQHRRVDGMVRLLTLLPARAIDRPEPFVHEFTLHEARSKLSRWRKKDTK